MSDTPRDRADRAYRALRALGDVRIAVISQCAPTPLGEEAAHVRIGRARDEALHALGLALESAPELGLESLQLLFWIECVEGGAEGPGDDFEIALDLLDARDRYQTPRGPVIEAAAALPPGPPRPALAVARRDQPERLGDVAPRVVGALPGRRGR